MGFRRLFDGRSRAGHRLSVMAAAGLALMPAIAGAQEFPFERELRLDVDPMPGSRRVPGIDVAANGGINVDLWCNSVQGQLIVAGDTVTVVIGPPTALECPPERARGDEEMLAALSQVTSWRWDGDIFVLDGAQPLRFRTLTN
jgi:hypothetical protein